ncbi:MAG: hypothetical protein ABIM19_07260 [candidate division WOR-3 bacterium]
MLSFVVLLSQWTVMPVDTVGVTVRYPSLAIDSLDRAHIAYEDEGDTVKHAYWNGLAWVTEPVVYGGSFAYTSIDFDPIGRPHIAHNHGGSGPWHSFWNGSLWQTDTLFQSGTYPLSMVLNSQGYPYITYLGIGGGLRITFWNGSAWIIGTVDTCQWAGYGCSIAMDKDDRPHISYQIIFGGPIMHAYLNGSLWVLDTVYPNGGGNQGATSIAIDSQDRPHIAFIHSAPDYDLLYAFWDGSAWIIDTVDTLGEDLCSIALDFQDRPHIAYSAPYSEAGNHYPIRYAFWDGLSWVIETIDSIGPNTDLYHTDRILRLDSKNCPRVTYWKMDNNWLYYAHRGCEPTGMMEPSPIVPSLICSPVPGGALFLTSEATDIRIYSADGRLVHSGHLERGENRINLEQGVYLWRAEEYKGKVAIR